MITNPFLQAYLCGTPIIVAVFTPFVKSSTQKSLLECIMLSLLLQAFTIPGYLVLIGIVGTVMGSVMHKSFSGTSFFVIASSIPCSLITIFPLMSLTATKVLHLTADKQKETVRNGNVIIAIILWTGFWLTP